MLLHAVGTGGGDRVALLLHGMMGSAESWWRIAPLLVERGCRVLAVDLPGHGLSPSEPRLTIEAAADAVVATVERWAPGERLTAIGHSYGGTVLSASADRLQLDLAVYVDTTCEFSGGADRAALIAQYAEDRERRSDPDQLRQSRSYYGEYDAIVEAQAAVRFDPATAASISAGPDGRFPPGKGDIIVRADPSRFVTDDDAARMRARGVDVRSIPDAAHTVW